MTDFKQLPVLILILIFMLLVPATAAPGQSPGTDLSHIRESAGIKTAEISNGEFIPNEKQPKSPPRLLGRNAVERYNPVSLVLSGSLLTYQHMISPQLSNRCIYAPSCSHFSREIMEVNGVLHGIFLTADRISRCNRIAATDAPVHRIDFDRGLIRDESQRYHK